MRSKPTAITASTFAAVAISLLPMQASASDRGHDRAYHVSITNVTSGNQFTPVLAVVHSPAVALFDLGAPALEELATLAEGGDTAPLQALLEGLEEVSMAATTPGPSMGLSYAGESVEFEVSAAPRHQVMSFAAMILPTNDSFVALDSVALPSRGSVTYYAVGHDAGSEANDELCVHIPGPTCGEDGGSPDGEGFVHVSSGIHGIGDLPEEIYDWRNPMAKVVITRMR